MFTVPDAVVSAIRGPRTGVRARLLSLAADGTVQATWERQSGRLLGGSVTDDRDRLVRRSAAIELANTDGALSPAGPGDAFFQGSRARVERGVVVGGQPVWIPKITGVVTAHRTRMEGVLTVMLEDPTTLLAQPFGETLTIEAGTTAEALVLAAFVPVLDPIDGGSTWRLDGAGRTTPLRVFLEDEDRLAGVAGLLADLGLEVFADRFGDIVLRPVPDHTTLGPVRVFDRGPRTASILGLARSGTRPLYNRVIVVGQPPEGEVVRSVIEVTDTASPLHWTRIGVRTAPVHRSARIPDQAACNAVAAALLRSYALVEDDIDSELVPDPTIDAGDVVTFREETTRTNADYLVRSVTHPVVQGPMRIDSSRVVPVFAEVV
jgi:hypothetical protein